MGPDIRPPKPRLRKTKDEDDEIRNVLRKSQDNLEEILPHARQEYMGRLGLQPITWRREPEDKVFITKINMRRNKLQDEIPECSCLCHCGSDLALWRAKKRKVGITHARVLIPSIEEI